MPELWGGNHNQDGGLTMTDKQKEEVKAMYDDGWNPEDIAEELGYDETEVMEYCAEIL